MSSTAEHVVLPADTMSWMDSMTPPSLPSVGLGRLIQPDQSQDILPGQGVVVGAGVVGVVVTVVGAGGVVVLIVVVGVGGGGVVVTVVVEVVVGFGVVVVVGGVVVEVGAGVVVGVV